MKKLKFPALLVTALICTSCNFYEIEESSSSIEASSQSVDSLPAVASSNADISLESEKSSSSQELISSGDRCEGLDQVVDEFTAEGIDGQTYTQAMLAGKITLLNLWGTYCSPCVKEMPYLGEFHRTYASSNFQVVGVICDAIDSKTNQVLASKIEKANTIIEQTNVTYPTLLPCAGLAYFIYSTEYVPYSIFIDEHGHQLGDAITGSMTYNNWNNKIQSVINTYMN